MKLQWNNPIIHDKSKSERKKDDCFQVEELMSYAWAQSSIDKISYLVLQYLSNN